MDFHLQKCSTVHINKGHTTSKCNYKLRGHTMEDEYNIKYLGVTIANDMKWIKHVFSTSNKVNKTLGFLHHTLRINNIKMRKMAYQALVRRVLEYSSPVWDPPMADLADVLESVQRCDTRWVCYRYRQTSSVNNILSSLKTMAAR